MTTTDLVHKADTDGEGYCYTCGQHVRAVPGGAGTTWVHLDGRVAARTPAVVLAAQGVVADWQQRASELSTERDENTYDPNGETDDAIADTMADCAKQLDGILRPNAGA
jgi:hypothetical protein